MGTTGGNLLGKGAGHHLMVYLLGHRHPQMIPTHILGKGVITTVTEDLVADPVVLGEEEEEEPETPIDLAKVLDTRRWTNGEWMRGIPEITPQGIMIDEMKGGDVAGHHEIGTGVMMIYDRVGFLEPG